MPSQTEIQAALEAKGWQFMPYAPNEWQWFKFDADGYVIAVQCDQTWAADLREIGME